MFLLLVAATPCGPVDGSEFTLGAARDASPEPFLNASTVLPDTVTEDLPPLLPVGETLRYSGRFGVFGSVGEGIMSVVQEDAPGSGDLAAVRLDFRFEGRALRRSITDETTSWVDAETGGVLRYVKDESHPLGSRREEVEINGSEGRWEDRHDGAGGALASPAPLDELSFLYLLRNLDLASGENVRLDRHFDDARNPVEVRATGSQIIDVPAGTFQVDVFEMQVQDEERFGGTGRIVLYLARDELRTPVRIESTPSRIGTLVLELEARTDPEEVVYTSESLYP